MDIKSDKIIYVGAWKFSSLTGTLTKDGASVRLENRAAALFEFLCQTSGQLVTHEEIIQQVWGGRFISPNSVAVVISDVRRALGDDARNPKYIETLPKRGYRMIARVSALPEKSKENFKPKPVAPLAPSPHKRNFLVGLLGVATLASFVILMNFNPAKHPTSVFIKPVLNETNDVEYKALTTAVTELLHHEISRNNNLRSKPEALAKVIVTGNLILWDGHPAVSLRATSIKDGQELWSGIASGPETLLPKQVKANILEFAEHMKTE